MELGTQGSVMKGNICPVHFMLVSLESLIPDHLACRAVGFFTWCCEVPMRAELVAPRQSACLACPRPWVQFLMPEKEEQTGILTGGPG